MADNFYASYPTESVTGEVTSLNGLTGALTLVPGSGISITPSGSNITIANTASSGANTTLSNLTSPTAINQHLLPTADDLINLGTAITNRFKAGSFTDSVSVGRYPFGAATPGAALVDGAAPGVYMYNGGPDAYNVVADAGSGVSIENPGAGVSLLNVQNHLFSFKDSTSNTEYFGGAPAGVLVSTGMTITTTTGALTLPRMTTTQRDALTPINGMEIYNSTTDKFQSYENGAWVDVIGGGGGANTTLSNLGTTAINTNLLPASAGSADVGAVGLNWNAVVASFITNPSGNTVLDTASGLIENPAGKTVIDINNGQINDGNTGLPVMYFTGQHALAFPSGNNAVAFNSSINLVTEDQNGPSSYDITSKTGNTTTDQSNTGLISLTTGNATASNSGTLSLSTGTAADSTLGASISGEIDLTTGQINQVASVSNSGAINLLTGFVTDPTSSGLTGTIALNSGANAGTNSSGDIELETGTANTGNSGTINFQTGTTDSTAGGSGGVNLITGDAPSGYSGAINVSTGVIGDTAPGTSTSGAVNIFTGADNGTATANGSGDINLGTGGAGIEPTATANSGSLWAVTGSVTGSGSSGSIHLIAGAIDSGTRGFLEIDTLFMIAPKNSADPTSTGLTAGAVYYNTGTNKLKMYNGVTWETITSV